MTSLDRNRQAAADLVAAYNADPVGTLLVLSGLLALMLLWRWWGRRKRR